MKNLIFAQGGAIAAGVLCLVAYYVVFDLRYGWYLSPGEYLLIQSTAVVVIVALYAIWFAYPSPWLGVAVCALSFVLPPLVRPDKYVGFDWQFLPYVIGCCVLVGLSIELRRRGIKGSGSN